MSHHNPFGGTQQDLIDMAQQHLTSKKHLRDLLTAIQDIDVGWTDTKATTLEQLITEARDWLRMPAPVIKSPTVATTCLPHLTTNPFTRNHQ